MNLGVQGAAWSRVPEQPGYTKKEKPFSKKHRYKACEMPQQAKVFTAKSEDLSSIPKTYTVEERPLHILKADMHKPKRNTKFKILGLGMLVLAFNPSTQKQKK